MFPVEFVKKTFNLLTSVPKPDPVMFKTPFITGDQELGLIAVI